MEPLPFLVPLAGGLLIGTAAAQFLLITGRIAGISGLVAAATGIADSGPPWWHAAAFDAGLPLGAWLARLRARSGHGCYLVNPFAPSSLT